MFDFDPNDAMPDMSQAEEYLCERCEHPFFTTVLMVKKLSALISPSGQSQLVPHPVFQCCECKYINRSQFGLDE
jgi:hypothetical protein